MNSEIKLSVIIPSYNESENLSHGVLDEVHNYLKKQNYTYEVLVVDDGSKDNTVQLVKKYIKDKASFKLIENPHSGKAITVMTGMFKASGQVVLFTDMDQATPINQIEKLLPKFDQDYDIVIGSRAGREGAPLIRKIVAWGFASLRNIIIGLPFKDTQCGFKAFNQKAILDVFPKVLKIWQSMRYSGNAAVNAGFDVETLFIAKNMGFKIAEVPVEWRFVGTERVQIIKDALEALKDMLRIRLTDLTGKYD